MFGVLSFVYLCLCFSKGVPFVLLSPSSTYSLDVGGAGPIVATCRWMLSKLKAHPIVCACVYVYVYVCACVYVCVCVRVRTRMFLSFLFLVLVREALVTQTSCRCV
ncbi:hypothetical protein PTSG_12344 [Salpingoeca rosetta]|uniref:Secreted protein n=1 Tax=Salpingoeca rosetta (strain ATCC 50818 / BSB-021) TaxID=946362 RepID=F2UBS8_SALR5|nr:uncharacterized protein PTSG_12344 [Salpingoeca rosetta]EGD73944.1 hypothetical protein PTSG_12344 [Salpingoeca rosetta]|eukprot:XP_004993507.1 hypothetical protein PTSG_12344 [Salpingoeca rosetta]